MLVWNRSTDPVVPTRAPAHVHTLDSNRLGTRIEDPRRSVCSTHIFEITLVDDALKRAQILDGSLRHYIRQKMLRLS
jgi:hypothetical protein